MDRNKLTQAVDSVPDLRGAGIGYLGDGQCMMVRNSNHNSGIRTYVVFQEVETTPFAGLSTGPGGTVSPLKSPQVQSHIFRELAKAGLDCGGVVLSAGLEGASALSIPVSAGFSTVPMVIANAAFLATSLRCGMDIGRLWNAGYDPSANRVLDNSEWYPMASTFIEAIDVTDAARSGLTTIAKYQALRRASSKPLLELLKGAPRSDRKLIAEEMAKFTGEAGTRKSFLRLVRQGKLGRLYTVKQVRVEVAKGLIEAALSGKTLLESALPGGKGKEPGVVNRLVVNIVQEN